MPLEFNMEDRLASAKAYLGEAWVLHPRYDPRCHPAHTTRHPAALKRIEARARAAGRI